MPGEEATGLISHLMSWMAQNRTAATVFFVTSVGLNLTVEAVRRETRLAAIEVLRTRVKATRQRMPSARAGVIAVGLMSLMETAFASMLNEDAAYLSLGKRRFVEEVTVLAERIADR